MLLRLGVVFSRIFLASAALLLIWAIAAFLRTGIWHAISLAEALAFYRITVPDFGLPGLAAIYAFLGSKWLLFYFLLFGAMIAVASARAAPGSTIEYLKFILLLPYKIAEMTISGLFYVIRGIIKYTFITLGSFVVLVCLWWGMNYFLFAYKFEDSPSCALRQTMFGQVPRFNFIYDCADASGVASTEDQRFYVLFMANQEHPGPNDSGHAWLATAALKRSNGDWLLTHYEVTGYGPPGGPPTSPCYPTIERLYLVIRPAIPFSSMIEQHWCEKGGVRADGPPPIDNPAGVPVPKVTDPSAVDAMLGVRPAVVFAVSISKTQFEKAQHFIAEQRKAPSNYQLGLNDCTTFVRDVASAIRLYVPPRLLAPYPSESIFALMTYNLRQSSAPSS
jgi:hypothetical protein